MNQRPIKFRAFHKPTKRMFEVYDFNEHVVFEDSMDGVESSDTLPADRADCILIEFTGLKTDDGTEIYEGDILRHEYEEKYGQDAGMLMVIHNPVVFQLGAFGYIGENTGKFISFAEEISVDGLYSGCTVAGNVYQHPELLEESQPVEDTVKFNPERYKGLGNIEPAFSGNLCNWLDWQGSIKEMAKLDGMKLTADEWDDLRESYFNSGDRSMTAYECYFTANKCL